jgi:aerobic carbon-monoxide dehydrogenase large subunit
VIGERTARLEDHAFLTGQGRYVADLSPDGMAHLVFLRSDYPAGNFELRDLQAARALPGVLAILTADDLTADGIGLLAPARLPNTADGQPVHVPPYPPLAAQAVYHVGAPLVAVVAETLFQAQAAAEAIEVVIEAAPFAVRLDQAAVPVWNSAPKDRVFTYAIGDAMAVSAAMATAAHTVSTRLAISRVTAATMEPRGALGIYDPTTSGFTLYAGTQAPHGLARGMAGLMGVPPEQVNLAHVDCGGSFGMRNAPAPEYAVVLAAARRLGRPVRWIETRSEAFLADPQAREQIADATLALDAEGRFVALDVQITAAMGAFVGPSTLHASFGNLPSLCGVYKIPVAFAHVEGLHRNTQTVAAYRGAGRPEASYIIERLIDIAARRLGFDKIALRRKNMLHPTDLPYETSLGYTYDSGDFPGLMDAALTAADWAGFEARRAEAAMRGQLRGLGIACTIEIAGGPTGTPAPEYGRLELSSRGCLLHLGTGDAGQGHRTTFVTILADRLGLPPSQIRFVAGSSHDVARGTGTFGSRSTAAAGTVLHQMTEELRTALIAAFAKAFDVPIAEVAFEEGAFCVPGTNMRMPTSDLVASGDLHLISEKFASADAPTYPNGCHITEVEIDPDTGGLTLCRYLAAEDLGCQINPMLVEGQIHGGIVQGIGQATGEAILYDPATGQLLTGSFMDYAMPRAIDLPNLTILSRPTRTVANPLGVKGAGEAGTVGALASTMSAVADALAPLGIHHVDMPASPCALWTAIQTASGR